MLLDKPKQISEPFQQYSELIKSSNITDLTGDRESIYIDDHIDLANLEQPFLEEETRSTVFNLSKGNAPGPDGFPTSFY